MKKEESLSLADVKKFVSLARRMASQFQEHSVQKQDFENASDYRAIAIILQSIEDGIVEDSGEEEIGFVCSSKKWGSADHCNCGRLKIRTERMCEHCLRDAADQLGREIFFKQHADKDWIRLNDAKEDREALQAAIGNQHEDWIALPKNETICFEMSNICPICVRAKTNTQSICDRCREIQDECAEDKFGEK